jgi:hypothetical protein
MKKIDLFLIISLLLVSTGLLAQAPVSDEDRFFYSEDASEDMAFLTPDTSYKTKGFQYGVILNPVLVYEKDSGSSLTSSIINARVWGKSALWNNSFLYIRVKNSYLAVLADTGTAYGGIENDNVLDLDLAYFSQSTASGNIVFSAGRKYYNLGTGVVLNGRGDGAELLYFSRLVDVKVFGLYTGLLLKDNNPYGLSTRDIADGAERIFAGGQLATSVSNQNLYIFGMAQIDQADEDAGTKSRYNSQYYGAGANGVFLKDFFYYGEFIYETGESYVSDTYEKSTIAAYAVNTGLNYYIPVKLNPVLSLQYAYGSGDKDRNDYTTGNRGSSTEDDSGFISFGTFSGGFALKPTLSNIHIFRGGASFTPFAEAQSPYIKKMTAGVKYAYYMKDVAESSIKSGAAGEDNKHIGHGVDLSLRWQIFYDMSFYLNYGIFLPGDAYSDAQEDIHYIQSGFNFSF